MPGNFHRVCKGDAGVDPANRKKLLAQWYAERETAAALARPRVDGSCVHLGPYNGKTRECLPCGGKTREKVYACALHGETTYKDCRRCKDELTVGEELGGMGPGAHSLDHYALSFGKGGEMALCEADGRADRSWENRFAGETFYFLGGGPSLLDVDLARISGRTIAVNSVCELFPKPTVWVGIDPPDDPPDRFRAVPWNDADVLKLLPRSWAGCKTGDGVHAYLQPSTRFFLRNHRWAPWQFLTERTVNWGADKPFGAARSVMLASLKLAWYLGARRIVLLGCDFHMDTSRPYCHSASKDEHGSATNNDKFGILERRLIMLRPYLEAAGLTVVNATVGTRLTAFDPTTLAEELARCSS